nr:hypothetical protein L204_01621 [Cryptococcus depauperatus CBS 7855]
MEQHFGLAESQHLQPNTHDETAEALIASLKAVINDPHQPRADNHDDTGGGTQHNEGEHPTLNAAYPGENQAVNAAIRKGLVQLAQLTNAHQLLLDELNDAGGIQNLAHNWKALKEGNKRQIEVLKEILAQAKASDMGMNLSTSFSETIDPELSPMVLRTEYEALKTQYDALLAASGPSSLAIRRSAAGRRSRISKAATAVQAADAGSLDVLDPERHLTPGGGSEGRKKRSIKLEHLIHQMANRRLGIEYTVSNYESHGSKDLPDPSSRPLTANESPNRVDEFRPDFRGDANASSVKPFVNKVVDDVYDAWIAGQGDDGEMSKKKILAATTIYWTRLCKRYDEQLHRERGEIHRDELSRRKQNQYRRQQSLLMRRTAIFDYSPLNACRLRALYRTLLTIDFAAPTTDQPDPKREYTPEEWYAYRKLTCGSRAEEAHEVVDQFWMSSTVKILLSALDEFSQDQAAKAKKKGKPKQPNPTFHLPSQLWDRSTLPTLRPKDSNGLPISGASGIILFKFHVDEQVQRENPEWAKGLYDNPPIPAGDESLPALSAVLSQPVYASLRLGIRDAKDRASLRTLTPEQVEQINAGVDLDLGENGVNEVSGVNNHQPPPGLEGEGEYMTFAALSQLTNNHSPRSALDTMHQEELPSTPGSTSFTGLSGAPNLSLSFSEPYPPIAPRASGTSSQARKLGKRGVSELPGGAATPVAKRRKGLKSESLEDGADESQEVDEALSGDAVFLGSI